MPISSSDTYDYDYYGYYLYIVCQHANVMNVVTQHCCIMQPVEAALSDGHSFASVASYGIISELFIS